MFKEAFLGQRFTIQNVPIKYIYLNLIIFVFFLFTIQNVPIK